MKSTYRQERRFWSGLFLMAWLAAAAPARAVVGYGGSTWGQVTQDFGGLEGLGSMGYVEQGVDWVELPGHTLFRSYADYRWRLRTLNTDYYNERGFTLGSEFQFPIFRLGARYDWSDYTSINENTGSWSLYLGHYYNWDLSRWPGFGTFLGIPIVGYPGSTWGFHATDCGGPEGFSTMGYFQQGIDWFILPGDIPFQTFGLYHWRLRSKNRPLYNEYGPAVGASLRHGPFEGGYDYNWQYYPGIRTMVQESEIFVRWYYTWDLKHLR